MGTTMLVFFFFVCAALFSGVNAGSFHLNVNSASNYTWEDATSWVENAVPGSGDDVYLNVSSNSMGAQIYVNINSAVVINSLSAVLQVQLFVTLVGSSTLTTNTAFDISCFLEGPGTFIIPQTATGTFGDKTQWIGVTVQNHGSVNFVGDSAIAILQDSTIENYGTWTWAAADTITKVAIADSDGHQTEAVFGMIVNSGTMTWIGQATSTVTQWFMYQSFNNTGTFNLQRAIVQIGSTDALRQMPVVVHQNGVLNMDSESQWWVQMGTYYCDPNHVLNGTGWIYVLDTHQNSKSIGAQFIVSSSSCNITNLYLEGWSQLLGATSQSVLYVDTFTFGLAEGNVSVPMVVKTFIGQPPIQIIGIPSPPCYLSANLTITGSGNFNGKTSSNAMYTGPGAFLIVEPNVNMVLFSGFVGNYQQPASSNPLFGQGTIINYGTVQAFSMNIASQFINYGTLVCNYTENSYSLQVFGGGANYGTIISQQTYDTYTDPNDSLCAFGGLNGHPFTFMPGSKILGDDGFVDLTGNFYECNGDYSSAACMATSTFFTSDISFPNAHTHPSNAIAIPDGVHIFFENAFVEGGLVTKSTGSQGTGTLVIGNGLTNTVTEGFGNLVIDSINVHINGSFQANEQAFRVQNNGNLTIDPTGTLTLQSTISTPVSNKPGYLINNGQLIFAAGEDETPTVTVSIFNNGVINTTTGLMQIYSPYYPTSNGKIILNIYSATKYDTWSYNFPQGSSFSSCPIGGNIVFVFHYTPANGDTFSFITYNGGSPVCSGSFTTTTTNLPSTQALNVRYDQSCFGMCAKAEVCASSDSTCLNQGPAYAGPAPTNPPPTTGGGKTTNGTSTDSAATALTFPVFTTIFVAIAFFLF